MANGTGLQNPCGRDAYKLITGKAAWFFDNSCIARFISGCLILSLGFFAAPSLAASSINDGVAAFNAGRYQDAQAYFYAARKEPLWANESLIYLSKINLHMGDAQNAVKYIDQALLVEPNPAEEMVAAGMAYCALAQQSSIFTALKMAKTCIAHYEAALTQEPANTSALSAAMKFHMDAPSIAGGSVKRGSELLERLAKISPEDVNTYKIHLLDKENKKNAALALADSLSLQGFKSAENQYAVAQYYKENQQLAKSKALFEPLLNWQETPQNRWYLQDAYLQLGELYLAEGSNPEQSIKLIEAYKKKNTNPGDKHYFWSTWSLAKAYKAAGQIAKYDELVKAIKTMNYKKDAAFSKDFEAGVGH